MARYSVRPERSRRAHDDGWYELQTAPLSHPLVYPSEPVPTGLVDASGRQIYRSPDPMGFLRFNNGEDE